MMFECDAPRLDEYARRIQRGHDAVRKPEREDHEAQMHAEPARGLRESAAALGLFAVKIQRNARAGSVSRHK